MQLVATSGTSWDPGVKPFSPRLPQRSASLLSFLGLIWLLDGLLQLQPAMFTSYLVEGVMRPAISGQPHPLDLLLRQGVDFTSQHIVLVNLTIALVQIGLGLSFLTGWYLRVAVPISIVWSLGVWLFGEGAGSLLTGQSSLLTGAPGPVLFYAVLALGLYPRASRSLTPARYLRRILAGVWLLGALLQSQPVWWHPHAISNAIAGLESPGTASGSLLDPVLRSLSAFTSGIQTPLQLGLIALFVGLAFLLWNADDRQAKPLLAISIGFSALFWVGTQGIGLLLTGSATDVNSGPLLILLALAAWNRGSKTAGPPTATRMTGDHDDFCRDVWHTSVPINQLCSCCRTHSTAHQHY